MTGCWAGRLATGWVLLAALLLSGCPTKYEPYDFTIRFVFPPGQTPLADLYSLEMDVEYDSGAGYTFYLQPVAGGNWELEGIPPVDEGGTVVLRFRGMAVDPTNADNVIEVANGVSGPVALGYDTDVTVYFSERHELALVEGALNSPRPRAGATAIDGGGAIVVGGGAVDGDGTVAGIELLEPGEDGRYQFTLLHPEYRRAGATLHRVDRSASPHHETVLIAGGFDAGLTADDLRAEIDRYDPAEDAITTILDLPVPLAFPALTELGDGRLLLSGGWTNEVDLLVPSGHYALIDPVASSAVEAGQMSLARVDHQAVELQDGSVLVCGGSDGTEDGASEDDCELWSPGGVSGTGALQHARERFAMLALPADPQGRVVAFGGRSRDGLGGEAVLDSVELYDPASEQWTLLGARMNAARAGFSVAPVPEGRFLVCGGADEDGVSRASCEVFDPDVVAFGPHPSASLAGGRQGQAATVLDGGLILHVGGSGAEPEKAYLYNP